MTDATRGIYHKFDVTRTDGSSAVGGKHESCFYFVLDCSHDPHAEAALKAYIASCRLEYPHLARDLECVLDECQLGRGAVGKSPVADIHGDEVALMDCPFCGSVDMTIEDARAPDDGLFVYCHQCLAQGPLCESRFTAALSWNARAQVQHGGEHS